MDDCGPTAACRRGPRVGGQRRAHRARHGDDPVRRGTPDLSAALWRRVDVGHGRAVGPYGLADRPRRNAWCSRTQSVACSGMRLDHARTVLGLSVDWPLVLELTLLVLVDEHPVNRVISRG